MPSFVFHITSLLFHPLSPLRYPTIRYHHQPSITDIILPATSDPRSIITTTSSSHHHPHQHQPHHPSRMPQPPSRPTLSDKSIQMLKDQGWYRGSSPGWHRISAAAFQASDNQWEDPPRRRRRPSPTLPLQSSPLSATSVPDAGGLESNALAVSSGWPHPLASLRDGVLHLLGLPSSKGNERTTHKGAATPSRLEAGLPITSSSSGGGYNSWDTKTTPGPGFGVGGSGTTARGGGLAGRMQRWGIVLCLLVLLLWLRGPRGLGGELAAWGVMRG